MKTILATNNTPMQELQFASESMTSFVSGTLTAAVEMTARVKALMPSIMLGFSETKEVGQLVNLKTLTKDEQAFLANIRNVSFAEMRALRADVPEGFHGNFLAYAEVLQKCAEPLGRLAPDVLNPYTVFLGQLISAKNITMLADDKEHLYKAMESDRKNGYKQIAAFFPTKKYESSQLVADVIARSADWKDLFATMKTATDIINSVDRQLLTNLIAQAEDYLEVIQDMLKNKKMEGITPETSKALAAGAYQVASQIEYYSVIYFRILGLTTAVSNTITRISKIYG